MDGTERKHQYWQITIPRLQQNHMIYTNAASCDTRLLFDSGAGWDTWSRLARPAPRTHQTLSTSKQRSQGPVSCLESLPCELLAIILSYLELSKDDFVALGMASEIFWPHTIQHVDKDYRRSPSIGPWAGFEIACTRTYITAPPPSSNKGNLALYSASTTNYG